MAPGRVPPPHGGRAVRAGLNFCAVRGTNLKEPYAASAAIGSPGTDARQDMKSPHWIPGNRVLLLENGEQFYPRLNAAIRAARQEVLIETFILAEDEVGAALRDELMAAAQRGARVALTVDGYGSSALSEPFVRGMIDAGVQFHLFDPRPTLLGFRTNLFRRLHRKLAVIDGRIGYCGGINHSLQHLYKSGTDSKQDYAVEVEGPVVAEMRSLMEALLAARTREAAAPRRSMPVSSISAGDAAAQLVQRDNQRHRDDIEWQYRLAIRSAQREVLIANAYFFPSWRLLRELVRASRRGVRVQLILQGEPDMPIMRWAARVLYGHLIRNGVGIHEYCERPLHGKVALVDEEFAMVGSSNLDPLSLSLNLEANLMIRSRAFTAELRARLEQLIAHRCQTVALSSLPPSGLLQRGLQWLVFHFLRRFPAWVGWLPGHTIKRSLIVEAGTVPRSVVEDRGR